MFWKKPPKTPTFTPAKPSREELIAQAKAHVAAARAEIGQETIDKMRSILMAQEEQKKAQAQAPLPPPPVLKETTPAQQAKKLIETMDKGKLADYIRLLSRDKD